MLLLLALLLLQNALSKANVYLKVWYGVTLEHIYILMFGREWAFLMGGKMGNYSAGGLWVDGLVSCSRNATNVLGGERRYI